MRSPPPAKGTPHVSEQDLARYFNACHAMQSGVAMEMELRPGSAATSPKHLRVGVNTAMLEHSAVVRLLLDRGLFTLDQYEAALADAAEAEARRYERRLSDLLGKSVTLG